MIKKERGASLRQSIIGPGPQLPVIRALKASLLRLGALSQRPRVLLAAGACAMLWYPVAVKADSAPSGSGPSVSLSLNQAIGIALSDNISYRQAIADERAAEARVVQATAGRTPRLTANYAYVHTQTGASFSLPSQTPEGVAMRTIQFSSTDINNVSAGFEYALYNGGVVSAAIGSATAALAAAQSQLAAARGTVVRDAVSAYFQLMNAQRNARIADDSVAFARQNLSTANELFAAGTAARADVLKQQLNLANIQVADIAAGAQADVANAVLANVLNINLGSKITPTEPLLSSFPTYSLEDVLRSAKSKRSELAAAQAAVSIAQNAVGAARAGALPSISVAVQEASSKPNFENVPQPQLSESLAIMWRLFDGGLTRGKLAEAAAQVRKAQLSLDQLKNGIDLEVRQSFFSFVSARAQIDAAKAAQAAADENLRVSRIRFQSGVGTSLELADALLADTQAQTQYATALGNVRIALTSLQRAAGLLVIPIGSVADKKPRPALGEPQRRAAASQGPSHRYANLTPWQKKN